MSELDDLSFLTKNDPMKMSDLTHSFAEQCEKAWDIAMDCPLPDWNACSHVLLTGLGGSAAGGDLTSAIYSELGTVPFSVNRDYSVPSFVGENSLVFCASYSGNTEETLSAYAEAKSKGAKIIVVTSGGKIADFAKSDGYPVILVPGGQPPRTALGNMMLPLIVASQKLGYLPIQDIEGALSAIKSVRDSCGFDIPEVDNHAKQLARKLHGKLATFYACSGWIFSVCQRWRGQINENSKEMVLTHVFPELCHNEILGWQGAHEQGVNSWQTVLLESGDESERMMKRIKFTLEEMGDVTQVHHVKAEGETLFAKMLSLAHFGDYLSLYLAALGNRDPGEMDAIEGLKAKLAALDH